MAIAASASVSVSGRGAVVCGLISSDGPYRKIGGNHMVETIYGTQEHTLAAFTARTQRVHAEMLAGYKKMKKKDRR